MRRVERQVGILTIASCALCPVMQLSARGVERPNTVLIPSDDLGYSDIGQSRQDWTWTGYSL